jgi:hypothetical protein
MANWADVIGGKQQTMPYPLAPYTVEIDQMDRDRWNAILQEFDDATCCRRGLTVPSAGARII